jgi:2-methylisocitrate lyase-like PEP mutase family enzyme
MTQTEKAGRFQALHQRAGAFLIPNPWYAGSARILAGLGFEAFATSSGAAAATYGRRDGKLTRDEAIASTRSPSFGYARRLREATGSALSW